MGDVIPFKKREPAHRQPPPKSRYCTHWTTEVHKGKWVYWPEPRTQETDDHEPQP